MHGDMEERQVREMNIYFDMEFTGLHKNTTPISIGLVTEDGDTFYAEFNDYDDRQCDNWIRENVIKNLEYNDKYECFSSNNACVRMKGNSKFVSTALRKWLMKVSNGKRIQFISDVCHYDMVLLIDIITNGRTAFDLLANISPACHDINQDIATCYNISDKEAFDKSREEIVASLGTEPPYGDKHNSLYDAQVIKKIYERNVW